MAYLTIILAVIATCIAIRGETWNSNETSWPSLTTVGWLAPTIAILSAGLEAYKTQVEHSSSEFCRRTAVAVFRNLVQQPKSYVALEVIFSQGKDPDFSKALPALSRSAVINLPPERTVP